MAVPSYAPGYGTPYIGSINVSTPTLSTAPPPQSSSSGTPYMAPGYFGGWGGGWGNNLGMLGAGPGVGYGAALQGMASLQQAQGQYWKDIQDARITREQSRQKHFETQRKQMEWEMEYEKLRPTAPKLRAQERATDLDWARNEAPSTEIWAGRTLNVLLRSILASPAPTRGPNVPISSEILRGLNLTDRSTRGSLALAKDQGKIDWTESLQESPFDELRDRFTKDFEKAMAGLNSGEVPPRTLQRDLQSTLKQMGDKLLDMVRDLPPSRYIESRRLLNQLGDTVKGLSNPRLVRAHDQDWRRTVRTVAELVKHCMDHGVEFGPAVAPEDYSAYTAAYYAIRTYERGVTVLSTSSGAN